MHIMRLGRYLGNKWHRHPCNMSAKFGMLVDEDCDNLSSVNWFNFIKIYMNHGLIWYIKITEDSKWPLLLQF